MGDSVGGGATAPIMDTAIVYTEAVCAHRDSTANSAICHVPNGAMVRVVQRSVNVCRKTLSLVIPKWAPVCVNLVTMATAARQTVTMDILVLDATGCVTALMGSRVTLKLESARGCAQLDIMERNARWCVRQVFGVQAVPMCASAPVMQ